MKILNLVRPIVLFALADTAALAQVSHDRHPALASHIIVPHARPFTHQAGTVQITEVNAAIEILEGVATTTLDLSLTNGTGARLEAELVLPVPADAVLRGFTFQGSAAEPTAQLLAKDEARRIYDAIVAKTRDPALLEFLGHGAIRSSVFPVEPRGAQKVRVTYEHILPADGDRVDYLLPRTESIDYHTPVRGQFLILATPDSGSNSST